jgi:Domain of unknown function (DUF4157)
VATTAADFFHTHYQLHGRGVDLSGVRVHTHADAVCRALGARALAYGSDIFFRSGAFVPHERMGLRLLAHEVAHVVQQRRGPVAAYALNGGLAVGPCDGRDEREAEAAADAAIAGQPFEFATAPPRTFAHLATGPVVQRYMSWEHLALGDADPEDVRSAADRSAGPGCLTAVRSVIEAMGRDPQNADISRLEAAHPNLQTVRLPGSGLVVTLGELNILPDYISHPDGIEAAPAGLILPLIQSVRSWNLRELNRVLGGPGRVKLLNGSMKYPRFGGFAELYEAVEVDALGRKCGITPWELYSSVLSRNAAHFAPFSWYRWQSFHLKARDMILRSAEAPASEREELRARARLYAGYADHFLQDSFAAGHLINKTLIMQWYAEWLGGSPLPVADRHLLAAMTYERQPSLHGPDYYHPEPGPDGERLYPRGVPSARTGTDPQTALEAGTLDEQIVASGIAGDTSEERCRAYASYLAMLGSSVVQLAPGTAHGYFNKQSLVVADRADGPRFRIYGDRYLFENAEGAGQAAAAAGLSRRVIAELLENGHTEISSRDIFARFPDHVEVDGALMSLPQWHETVLREQCFEQFFRLRSTRAMRVFLTVASRRLGVPSEHYSALRAASRGRAE